MKTNNNPKLPFVSDKNLRPVILGILIVVAGFATFNIFNRFAPGDVDTKEEKVENETTNNIDKNNEKEVNNNEKENNNTTSDKGISDVSNTTTSEKSLKWVANNYKLGDISAGSYTVVKGDTLWEISEAVYGDGTQWHKIEKANDISYLPNGNPLIVPGQKLNIPQK